jgi:hypothetical protein
MMLQDGELGLLRLIFRDSSVYKDYTNNLDGELRPNRCTMILQVVYRWSVAATTTGSLFVTMGSTTVMNMLLVSYISTLI